MGKPRKRSRPPADPEDRDPAGSLPSDQGSRSVTVKLDSEDRRVLGRCRRLLAGTEGDTYPTASHTIRLALGALYQSLTGHTPEGDNHAQV